MRDIIRLAGLLLLPLAVVLIATLMLVGYVLADNDDM